MFSFLPLLYFTHSLSIDIHWRKTSLAIFTNFPLSQDINGGYNYIPSWVSKVFNHLPVCLLGTPRSTQYLSPPCIMILAPPKTTSQERIARFAAPRFELLFLYVSCRAITDFCTNFESTSFK